MGKMENVNDQPEWMKKWSASADKGTSCKNEYTDAQNIANAEQAILAGRDIVEPRADGKERMVRTREYLINMATDRSVAKRAVDHKNNAKKVHTIPDVPITHPTYPLDSECRKCGSGIVMKDELLGCNEELIDAGRFNEYAFKGGCPKWFQMMGTRSPVTEAPAPLRPGATMYARTPQQDDIPTVIGEIPYAERRPDMFPNIEMRIGRRDKNTEASALMEYARTPYGLLRVKELENELAQPIAKKGRPRDAQESKRLRGRHSIEREAFSFVSFSKPDADAYCPFEQKTFKVKQLSVLGDGLLRIMCPHCNREHTARIGG
jgi:hypothetical protein